MRYKLQKETNISRRSYGKYVARAVHPKTISQRALMEEIQSHCSATVADCHLVLCELAETIVNHLHEGDVVELPYLGKIKLEIECQAVDEQEQFKAAKHIKGVRLHLLPESKHGEKKLYNNIKYKRVR